jgi:hypothetical protein
MKFWKKESGECGTMDDNGYVPDSEGITEEIYQEWISSQPVAKEVDHKSQYSVLESDSERIEFIAKKLDLIE